MNQKFEVQLTDDQGKLQAAVIHDNQQVFLETPKFTGEPVVDRAMRTVLFINIANALRSKCYPEDLKPLEESPPTTGLSLEA